MHSALPLPGYEYQELLSALLSAYDTHSFGQMLRIELDKSMEHYAPVGAPLKVQISAVIEASEREGWTDQLVRAAAKYNPGNPALARFAAKSLNGTEIDASLPAKEPPGRSSTWVKVLAVTSSMALIAGMVGTAFHFINRRPDSSPVPVSVTSSPSVPSAVCEKGIAPGEEQLADMAAIPGSTFVMGDNLYDRPQHEVTVGDFWIDRFEVTNLQYQQYLEASGASPPAQWNGTQFPEGQTAFQPVTSVTWQDAVAFCAASGKRLPTEAEWEYACRGSDNRRFPWGDDVNPGVANTAEIGCGKALSVGAFSPEGDSVFGVADMVGNVLEWTASIASAYPFKADDQDRAEDGDVRRGVRSGPWHGTQEQQTCAVRSFFPPDAAPSDLGFRCARSADGHP